MLKRSSLEEMWQPVLKVPEDDGAVSMGLAFFLERRFGLDLVAHSGTQNGFLSHFFVHVPSRTAYLVAYNTQAGGEEAKDAAADGSSTRTLDNELRDYLLSEGVSPDHRGEALMVRCRPGTLAAEATSLLRPPSAPPLRLRLLVACRVVVGPA